MGRGIKHCINTNVMASIERKKKYCVCVSVTAYDLWIDHGLKAIDYMEHLKKFKSVGRSEQMCIPFMTLNE